MKLIKRRRELLKCTTTRPKTLKRKTTRRKIIKCEFCNSVVTKKEFLVIYTPKRRTAVAKYPACSKCRKILGKGFKKFFTAWLDKKRGGKST